MHYPLVLDTAADHDYISYLCQKHSKRINCHLLSTFDNANVSGETLQQLHGFCTAKPSSKVVYLTNQLQGTLGVGNTDDFDNSKIQAITSAVTSKMCLRPCDTCNVCGLEFYPLPFSHFASNMFSASCEYVKGLLSPWKFEKEINDLGDDSMIMNLRDKFLLSLFPFTPQSLGMQQYSIEHWIGAHPNLKPCDVAPMNDVSWNEPLSIQMNKYSWALAPRRSGAPPGHPINAEKESSKRRTGDVVIREYYYLAGNLFRWYRLYNVAPDDSSWVWQWFPDGQIWNIGVKLFGSEVVNRITQEYASIV